MGNKVIFEIIIIKHKKNKKQYERDQQTIKSFDKSCRNILQDNIIDKIEYESQCSISTKYLDETKNESFL